MTNITHNNDLINYLTEKIIGEFYNTNTPLSEKRAL